VCAKGVYFVQFINNPAEIALVSAASDEFPRTDNATSDNIVSVTRIEGGDDDRAFRVDMRDADDDDDGSDPQDGGFNILVS
jgi:hypothetical protein